ncbi:MAG: hypothetical protein DWQ31_10395 [Planctomycetota bacterium]|nr:MAG: hypothetical protein DWQ31_10395 [Planctomycetota bacterium]REJ98777.1 MAG: hypothetical protein DWQ35_00155 [Planctomycetota bacterium]REK27622.1 MAG: hypothetical protein DWQ42_06555 [Planctomycetota bacterium]REK43233.1 MAG: hypothetical protein DWQ46_12770 [Planctomycetota bacterium]
MSRSPLRIIKLGGSLLDRHDLVERFERWLSRQTPAKNVVVPGGGPLVDSLRQLCAEQQTDEVTAHRLALRAMSVTARLTAAMTSAPLVAVHPADLMSSWASDETDLVVLDTSPSVCPEETGQAAPQRTCDLPQSWQSTGDSIAAWVAREASASELVLLKSALPPHPDWHGAAAAGYVDEHFPRIVRQVAAARCVNLRDDTFLEWRPAETANAETATAQSATIGFANRSDGA